MYKCADKNLKNLYIKTLFSKIKVSDHWLKSSSLIFKFTLKQDVGSISVELDEKWLYLIWKTQKSQQMSGKIYVPTELELVRTEGSG